MIRTRRQNQSAPVPLLPPASPVVPSEFIIMAAAIGEAITTTVMGRMKDMVAKQIAQHIQSQLGQPPLV